MDNFELEVTGNALGFSWLNCDRCYSPLGGDRYDWKAFNREFKGNNNSFQLERDGLICTDCVFDIAG